MYKSTFYILIVFVFFITTAFQCGNQCEADYTFRGIKDTYIIHINKNNLSVNDTLWINSTITNKVLNQDNFTHEIKTSEFNHKLHTSIKTNFNTEASINFGDFIISDNNLSYAVKDGIIANYIKINNDFKLNFGIILKQKGEYTITTDNEIMIQGSLVENGCENGGFLIPVNFSNNKKTFNFSVN